MTDENGIPLHMGSSEGRIVYKSNGSTWFTETQVKDHLGSVRAVCSLNSTTRSRITRQVDAYYPFGMNIKELSQTSDAYLANEYMYNGKMYQDEMGLNWLDYGARFYDAVLGRWHSVDPASEISRRWSPYTYCYNNPMRFVDPDGMVVTDYGIKENGDIQRIGPVDNKPDRLFAINNDKSIKKDVKPITLADKKLLPELAKDKGKVVKEDATGMVTQSGIKQTAKSSNETDMANVFKFCADNSKAEWTVNSDSKHDEYAIGTYGLDDTAPSADELGMDSKNVTKNNHSHPLEKTKSGEEQSLSGDKANSMSRNYSTDVYMPNSGNIYRVNKGKSELLKSKSISL